MSAHTAEVKVQLGNPNRWYAMCPVCGPVGWSEDPEEAHRIADEHTGD